MLCDYLAEDPVALLAPLHCKVSVVVSLVRATNIWSVLCRLSPVYGVFFIGGHQYLEVL